MNLHPTYTKIAFFASLSIFLGFLLLSPERALSKNCRPEKAEIKNTPPPPSSKAKGKIQTQKQAIAEEVSRVVELVPAPGMSFDLMMGMIEQESSFDPNVRNFEEKAYPRILRKVGDEKLARKMATSIGLTQVQLATAMQYGIQEKELKEDWKLQIHLGALELGKCLEKERGNRNKAVACYNAGRGKKVYPPGAYLHASRVLKRAKKFA